MLCVDIVLLMARGRKGFKALSPRLLPERIQVRLPKELLVWVRGKADREGKSISLLIAEILEEARRKEGF